MNPRPKSPPDGMDLTAELTSVLAELTREHERLLEQSPAMRRAIAAADGDSICALQDQQRAIVQRIAELDARRGAVASRLAIVSAGTGAPAKGAGAPPSCPPKSPPTVTALAERLPEPAASRVRELAASLRTVIERVNAEQHVLQTAAASLAQHMDGLMRQVARALSHAGTYTPPTRITRPGSAAQVATSLDVRS